MISNILHGFHHGTQMGWLIDPNEQLVQVFRPNQRPTSLEMPADTLAVFSFAQALALTVGSVLGWLRVQP